ncbi:radical SAM family heme chaperone HemW [bacterium]|nr:radical SAM family heme chaperone HemW [bacterium]
MSEPLTLPRHLYVHVPLCRSKCSYCDFYSVTPECDLPDDPIALRLLTQAEGWLGRGLDPAPLRTLYVGGGTPTMLGWGLAYLVEGIAQSFGLEPNAEVTIEANPDSLDGALVRVLTRAGVTRISLGMQSVHDSELQLLGRPHTAQAAFDAAALVRDAGLEVSVDLMCGIPGQTLSSWHESLKAVVDAGCAHVSVYPLSLEDGTPLAEAAARGEATIPDEDAVAEMLEFAAEVLHGAGLQRYEVANFAKPGHESMHNRSYWTGAEYLGVGPSAHGMLWAATASALGVAHARNRERTRYSVPADLWEGLEPAPPLEFEYLTEQEALREDAMLGLRMTSGISVDLAEMAHVTKELEELADAGLVERMGGIWRVTGRGWLLGNEVFSKVWLAQAGDQK